MARRIVDLSHPMYHEMPVWPGTPPVGVLSQKVDGGEWNMSLLVFSSHAGTHMDAPYHLVHDGVGIDELPLNSIVGDALVIDVKHRKPGDEITVGDVEKYRKEVKEVGRVILCTGHYKHFGRPEYYKRWAEVPIETAEWMVEQKVKLLGIDGPSVAPLDPKQDKAVHEVLLKNNVIPVENLTNLEELRTSRMFLICLPLKLKGRDGSPVRAVAIVEE